MFIIANHSSVAPNTLRSVCAAWLMTALSAQVLITLDSGRGSDASL